MPALGPHQSLATIVASKTNQQLIPAVANYVLIGGFVLVIGLAFLGVFQGDVSQKIAKAEGRPATAFPELDMKHDGLIPRPNTRSVKDFPPLFESWLNDRIGFRRQLIQMYQVARHYGWTPALLSKTPAKSAGAATAVLGHHSKDTEILSGRTRVLIGEEGWLFYQSSNTMDDYRGTNLFSESELAEWKRVLTQRRDWLAKRGIHYVFVIAPNKHAIYPEYMPQSVMRVSENSRIKQLAEYLKSESDLAFISLLDPILKAKSHHRVFHKTDTHWNSYGAFVGGREVLKSIEPKFPGVYVPIIEDYEVTVHDCSMETVKQVSPWIKLDLALMMGSPIPYREDVINLVPRRKELQVSTQIHSDPQSEAELVRRSFQETGAVSKVYILHDSYMMALSPYLAPNFRDVTYHWTNDFPADAIERERPVLVIQQMVQRRLMNYEPANPEVVTEELRREN